MSNVFVHKPSLVQAVLWTGHNRVDLENLLVAGMYNFQWNGDLLIALSSGLTRVPINTYILKDDRGQISLMEKEDFERSYEKTT